MTAVPGTGHRSPLIAFVHIQKAAGTSLKFIVKNSLGVRHCDVNPVAPPFDRPFDTDDLAFVRAADPWLCSISGHEIIEPTRHLGDAVAPYTMLRDPVRRSISHYQDKIAGGRRDLSFEAFIGDPANHNFQVRKIAGGDDLDKAVQLLRERYFFVGLAERFAGSIRLLRALCPYPLDIRWRPGNVAEDRRVQEALEADPSALRRIEAANRLDRRLWDFVDRELLPALAARAGGWDEVALPRLPRGSVPWRFHASRGYHRLVYRSLLKRARRRAAHS